MSENFAKLKYLNYEGVVLVLVVDKTIKHEILGSDCAPKQTEIYVQRIVIPENVPKLAQDKFIADKSFD